MDEMTVWFKFILMSFLILFYIMGELVVLGVRNLWRKLRKISDKTPWSLILL